MSPVMSPGDYWWSFNGDFRFLTIGDRWSFFIIYRWPVILVFFSDLSSVPGLMSPSELSRQGVVSPSILERDQVTNSHYSFTFAFEKHLPSTCLGLLHPPPLLEGRIICCQVSCDYDGDGGDGNILPGKLWKVKVENMNCVESESDGVLLQFGSRSPRWRPPLPHSPSQSRSRKRG